MGGLMGSLTLCCTAKMQKTEVMACKRLDSHEEEIN